MNNYWRRLSIMSDGDDIELVFGVKVLNSRAFFVLKTWTMMCWRFISVWKSIDTSARAKRWKSSHLYLWEFPLGSMLKNLYYNDIFYVCKQNIVPRSCAWKFTHPKVIITLIHIAKFIHFSKNYCVLKLWGHTLFMHFINNEQKNNELNEWKILSAYIRNKTFAPITNKMR